MLTIPKTKDTLKLERLFDYQQSLGGIIKMSITKNEMELLNILSENDNPEEALMTAIKVFSAFVEQLEEAPVLQAAVLQESF